VIDTLSKVHTRWTTQVLRSNWIESQARNNQQHVPPGTQAHRHCCGQSTASMRMRLVLGCPRNQPANQSIKQPTNQPTNKQTNAPKSLEGKRESEE
jgi:hypothetical protein